MPEAEVRRSLADLRFVNRWLGNRRLLAATVSGLLDGIDKPRLLDVGCGSGDLVEHFRRQCPRPLLAVGLDIKLTHLRSVPPLVRTVVADVRQLPFPPGSFDVVTASLFLHHFDTAELVPLLRGLHLLARRALVVNDLRRARVPYLFGRLAFSWLFASPVSVADGLVSIRRGFRCSELQDAFKNAGIPVRVERSWPYRLLAVAETDRGGDHA
ncbi:MAG TPA: methyltransferase domain-containing protein [Vicinamibacteria bacterium]|nr:methyltransferase domain-containing protein [Vicinamibacteria bacterium]